MCACFPCVSLFSICCCSLTDVDDTVQSNTFMVVFVHILQKYPEKYHNEHWISGDNWLYFTRLKPDSYIYIGWMDVFAWVFEHTFPTISKHRHCNSSNFLAFKPFDFISFFFILASHARQNGAVNDEISSIFILCFESSIFLSLSCIRVYTAGVCEPCCCYVGIMQTILEKSKMLWCMALPFYDIWIEQMVNGIKHRASWRCVCGML